MRFVAVLALVAAACSSGSEQTVATTTSVPAPSSTGFEEVTEQWLPPLEAGYGRGVSVVDIDGDGWDDLFISDTDTRSRGEDFRPAQALHNEGGTFVPWDLGFAPDDLYLNGGAIFGDYTNDGAPDVLLLQGNNTGGALLSLYENRLATEGRFAPSSERAGVAGGGRWWGATWGDLDSDGWLDLAVTSLDRVPESPGEDQGVRLYMNQGDGTFVDEAGVRGLVVPQADWRFSVQNPVIFDMDGDHDLDVFLGGGTPRALFENDGDGVFTDVTPSRLDPLLPDEWWRSAFASVAEDFDQNGSDDLYIGRWWYQDQLLLNSGDGTFTAHGPDVGIDLTAVPEDETLDLGSSLGGSAVGRWAETETAPIGRENTMGLSVGDLDMNGVPDILIGTGDPSVASPDVFLCGELGGPAGVSFQRCGNEVVDAIGPTRQHGMAVADLDLDGANDLVVNPGGFPVFDEQTGADTRESVRVFSGAPAGEGTVIRLDGSGRPLEGTELIIDTEPARHLTVRSGQGFMSQTPAAFSLSLTGPATVTVRWPDGSEQRADVAPGDDLVVRR